MPISLRSYPVTADDGVKIQVFEKGPLEAPVVYLVHGIGSSHNYFSRIVDSLAVNYRVVTYDHRGHGESGDYEGNNCTLIQLGRDLATVMRHVQGNSPQDARAFLLGHSMGGMVVGSWLHQFGDVMAHYISGLALCNTAFSRVIQHTKAFGFHLPPWKILKDLSWITAAFPVTVNSVSRYLYNRLNFYSPGPAGAFEKHVAAAPSVSPESTKKLVVDITHMDYSDVISKINVPTTVLNADEDRMLDPQLGVFIAKKLQERGYLRSLKELPCTGHDTFNERPELVRAIITAAINDALLDKITLTSSSSN